MCLTTLYTNLGGILKELYPIQKKLISFLYLFFLIHVIISKILEKLGLLYMSIKKELNYKLYLQREENTRHLDYEKEFGFYHAIATGNIERVTEGHLRYLESSGYSTSQDRNGVLSANPVQNQKFHFVILAAMIARFCAEAGLEREVAYSMSDIYIQKCDLCTSESSISTLQEEMIFDFTNTMKDIKKRNVYSRQITKCIDYIYDNLNQKLTVESIAEHLKIAPTYLSKLFTKEINIPLSTYIRERRLEAAANMLQYSDYEISAISEYFHFSSQSHFTSLFQAKYNLTPKKFRDAFAKKSMPGSSL